MKTIKQIADEIGVSKTAVRNKITPEMKTMFAETVSGVIYISPEGETLIKAAFLSTKPQIEVADVSENQFADVSGQVSALITMLQKELDIKNEQIQELNNRLAESNVALVAAQQTAQAAQALHAGTMTKQLAEDNTDLIKSAPHSVGFFARIFGKKRT